MWTTFQFACALSAMNPLKMNIPNLFFSTIAFSFLHIMNALNFCVLRLHVINCNHHDLIIDWVINVTSHGRPSLNMFYMIKHHPHILEVITRLHPLDQIKYGCNSIDKHLEQINLLPNMLTRKTLILNIIVTRKCFQF